MSTKITAGNFHNKKGKGFTELRSSLNNDTKCGCGLYCETNENYIQFKHSSEEFVRIDLEELYNYMVNSGAIGFPLTPLPEDIDVGIIPLSINKYPIEELTTSFKYNLPANANQANAALEYETSLENSLVINVNPSQHSAGPFSWVVTAVDLSTNEPLGTFTISGISVEI